MQDTTKYPQFIPDRPLGKDCFEGHSQDRLAHSVCDYVRRIDAQSTGQGQVVNSMPRIIGLEGGWGSGKSNVVRMIDGELVKNGYYTFTYDAWGHQEDLQRRSILETLTSHLIDNGVLQGDVKIKMRNGKVNKDTWKNQLSLLLSNKTTTIRKSTPKLTAAAFWGIGIVALFAICSLVAGQLIDDADAFKCYWWIDFIPVALALIVAGIYQPEMYDPSTPEGRDSYAGLQSELGRMTAEQREAIDAYYMPRNREFLSKNLTGKELIEWKYQNYIRDYMAVIASVDESVGRLLDYLDSHNLTENTIIVYTSDQGFYMGEHGWFDKRFMYEESFHTPLIISYPKHIQPQSVCNQMVQNIDFAPTFLDLAGVEKPKYMPGTSLQPLFAGKPVKKWRKSLYYHYYDYPTYHLVRKHDGVRTEQYKLIHFYGKGGERAVAENKYQREPGTSEYGCFQYLKSINYISDDADIDYYELYDIKADPNEMHNIYGQPGMQKVEKEMKKILATYRKNLNVDE